MLKFELSHYLSILMSRLSLKYNIFLFLFFLVKARTAGEDARTVFRKGRKMYGIYLPSISGRLDNPRLEAAYQKYSHRDSVKKILEEFF